jgi:Sulfatase
VQATLRGFAEPRRLRVRVAFAHLAALSAFAVAKPFFDILNAGALIEWYLTRLDVVVIAIGLVVVPPAVLLLAELAAGAASWKLRYWVHLVFVGLLCYLIAAYALRKGLSNPSSFPVSPVSLAFAAVAAAAYHALAGIRSFVTALVVAPALFLLLYLFTSSAAKVVFPSNVSPVRTSAAPTPVVIVAFDELPVSSLMNGDRRIDATRYPTFGALAKTATWYRNAITVHDFTRFSVPAILSGRFSGDKSFAVADDHRQGLFELLGRSHELGDQEGVTRVCPINLCEHRHPGGFPGRIADLLPQANRIYLRQVLPKRFANEVAPRQALPTQYPDRDLARFAASVGRRTSKPRFAFTYVQTPHAPYRYLPSGRRYRSPDKHILQGIGRGPTPTNRLLSDQLLQRHLAQVAFTDRALGRVFAALRRTGEFDRALVVVTADHGVSLRPGQYDFEHRATSPANAADTVGVPLFVKAPGQPRGRIDDTYARTIDIAPTVAAMLHARTPWRTDGAPLGAHRPIPARLEIRRAFGGPLSISSADMLRRRDAQAARVAGFGTGPADPGLFRWGPRPDLVGKPLQRVAARPAPAVPVRLDEPDAFDSVDLRGEVPAVVTGSLNGTEASGVKAVAVAVNGRVAATTWTYVDRGRVRFAAFTGDRWLHPGRNSVAVRPLP